MIALFSNFDCRLQQYYYAIIHNHQPSKLKWPAGRLASRFNYELKVVLYYIATLQLHNSIVTPRLRRSFSYIRAMLYRTNSNVRAML